MKTKDYFLKEFALKHPIITFLLCDSVITGVRAIAGYVTNTVAYGKYADTFVQNKSVEMPHWLKKEEENTDEQTESEVAADED